MKPNPTIEDNFEDVLGKAIRGIGLDPEDVAARAGVTSAAVEALLSGQLDEPALRNIAPVLNLNGDCLVELATNAASPSVVLPDGLALHNTAFPVPGYEEMTVNSYSMRPSEQPDEGWLVDAGAPLESIQKERGEASASNWTLFLTHTHADHIPCYDELSQIISNAYAPAEEPYREALPVREGEQFDLGPWQLTALETPGHSPGGTSYLLEGAGTPVVFVGDALFCYSIGKVAKNYDSALALIRKKILSLPEETILCPGHGPMTTVGFERKHNPFFA